MSMQGLRKREKRARNSTPSKVERSRAREVWDAEDAAFAITEIRTLLPTGGTYGAVSPSPPPSSLVRNGWRRNFRTVYAGPHEQAARAGYRAEVVLSVSTGRVVEKSRSSAEPSVKIMAAGRCETREDTVRGWRRCVAWRLKEEVV